MGDHPFPGWRPPDLDGGPVFPGRARQAWHCPPLWCEDVAKAVVVSRALRTVTSPLHALYPFCAQNPVAFADDKDCMEARRPGKHGVGRQVTLSHR